MLRKDKQSRDMEFASVYFDSTTKTVTNLTYDLEKSFKECLYRTDNWIIEKSGLITEFVDAEYEKWMKCLINIKNNDNKCFLWYLNI